jgi:hypothetical protein
MPGSMVNDVGCSTRSYKQEVEKSCRDDLRKKGGSGRPNVPDAIAVMLGVGGGKRD